MVLEVELVVHGEIGIHAAELPDDASIRAVNLVDCLYVTARYEKITIRVFVYAVDVAAKSLVKEARVCRECLQIIPRSVFGQTIPTDVGCSRKNIALVDSDMIYALPLKGDIARSQVDFLKDSNLQPGDVWKARGSSVKGNLLVDGDQGRGAIVLKEEFVLVEQRLIVARVHRIHDVVARVEDDTMTASIAVLLGSINEAYMRRSLIVTHGQVMRVCVGDKGGTIPDEGLSCVS